MKRIFLFLAVNVVVMAVGSTVLSLIFRYTGLDPVMQQNGLNYTSLMVICFVWGMLGSFISLFMSKFIAKKMMGVQEVTATGPYAQIVQKVHTMATRAGIENMPEVGIYESPEINAFATGYSKNSSLVAVSTGLLRNMNDDEVEGVLAHEIAHIANGDMVTMALIQGIVNAFVMFLSRIATHLIDNLMKDDEGRGGLGFFAYIILNNLFHFIFGFMAAPIVYWFSRWREYRADEGGARLAGKDKMISALQALQRNYPQMQEATVKVHKQQDEFRTMQISSPVKWNEIFSTHPSLDKRISALQANRLS